jgi:CRP/FNR family transcriptional regulator, cyclic AMP receptor protein
MARLSSIPLFRDAGIDLSAIEARALSRKFAPNEILIDFNDPSTDLYCLVGGSARVLVRTRAGKEVIFADLHPGHVFGELSAMDGVPRSANVTALSRGEVLILSSAVFREVVLTYPPIADRLIRHLVGRVRDLDTRLIEHTLLDVRHRLYAVLLRLSLPREAQPEQRVLTPPPVQHVLAARVGCSGEQVAREFARLRAGGIIQRTTGALVLCRPDVLAARIRDALRIEI